MGFGYAGTFLIIFLTHPGVIIPTMTSATSLLPPEAVEFAPKEGFPPVLSGLWQTLWAWILTVGGSRSDALAWTLYILYLIFLFLYMYYILPSRLSKGI
jgi:hypothetical protein